MLTNTLHFLVKYLDCTKAPLLTPLLSDRSENFKQLRILKNIRNYLNFKTKIIYLSFILIIKLSAS